MITLGLLEFICLNVESMNFLTCTGAEFLNAMYSGPNARVWKRIVFAAGSIHTGDENPVQGMLLFVTVRFVSLCNALQVNHV